MKQLNFLLILACLTGLVACENTCYLEGTVCKKSIEYAGKPTIDLFLKEQGSDDFILAKPPNEKITFYISSLQLDDNLYVAYQNYNGDMRCAKKDYIYSINVKYKLNVYYLSKKFEFKRLNEENLQSNKDLRKWATSLNLNQYIPLVCNEGEIGYSSWKRVY